MVNARVPVKLTRAPLSELQPRASTSKITAPDVRCPVSVFCRVRPLPPTSLSCVHVEQSAYIVLSPPAQALQQRNCLARVIRHRFKHVFEPDATQREVFALTAQPLIENLVRGHNSLLLTYGITGGGKTYTMTGNGQHSGLMPRCLDLLFRAIEECKAERCVFKPDNLNGFEVQSPEDALKDRKAYASRRKNETERHESEPECASYMADEPTSVPTLDEGNMYAVFVTYVEIYNNSVYDLLEEGNIQKVLQSRIIREDATRNTMYVHGATEVEVTSVEEALDAFRRGRKRKRMGHTVLNLDSSRSHTVFNIRLVQAPMDQQIKCHRLHTMISQLSMVDLAGSERCGRTNNTGARLREAGNINNSLMTLRTCLEYLRENQKCPNVQKKIPYREAKITHLFKNFFEREGEIAMIVCINPRMEDCEENMQVMKFAEMTQEVQTARATPMKIRKSLTSIERKSNKLLAKENTENEPPGETTNVAAPLPAVAPVKSDKVVLPVLNEIRLDPYGSSESLKQCLLQRIKRRQEQSEQLEIRCNKLRINLIALEKENIALRFELDTSKAALQQERERHARLAINMRAQHNFVASMNTKLSYLENQMGEKMQEVKELQKMIERKEREKAQQKHKYCSQLAAEIERKHHELEARLQEQREDLERTINQRDEKLRLVTDIIYSNRSNPSSLVRSCSMESFFTQKSATVVDSARTTAESKREGVVGKETSGEGGIKKETYDEVAIKREANGEVLIKKEMNDAVTQTEHSSRLAAAPSVPKKWNTNTRVATSNPRMRITSGDKWIDHRPPRPVPLGTILQPYLKKRKEVTHLTEIKDITGHKVNKYCLVSQEADTDGDVETKLYKGNVIRTSGGGAQVVFDDVECLKQTSPLKTPRL